MLQKDTKYENLWGLATLTSNNAKQFFFVFQNPKLPRHLRVLLRVCASFGEEGTEEHNLQEDFDHSG